ncbi:MAG TPA: serine/threonine-protein kinase [Gemmatimonadales bacterium]|nr:serine/threonine-protein kinase [Gemmatimonadales bacterium]
MTARLLGRRPSTPIRSTASSRPGQSLPSDVLGQTCRRLGIVGLVFAGLWAITIFMNSIVARWLGEAAFMQDIWPFPGFLVAWIGVVTSLLMTVLARRLSPRPKQLVDVGSAFLVIQCLLVSILSQWAPVPISPRVSWVCIPILFYPAIVPNTPRKTLVTSLLAASMEPLALGISHLRGVQVHLNTFYLLWDFLPNYICALLVVIPVKIIHNLGHQVRKARELGSYRLEEPLGKGGMGEVFRATHQMLARPAAVKLIRSEILGSSSPSAAKIVVERFRREAEAAALLRSPHTISLYDFGVAQDGTFFLVMELLDGMDLETLVERFGPVPPERAVYLLRQACASLEEAHTRGLVHRDIKPSNIFTCRMGLEVDFVKVLDFGLVKAVNDRGREATLLTAPDSTTGTPAYIAPEVIRGDGVADHRVDIYTLGCVGYWLLTGRLVFQAPNAIQLMYQHANAAPVAPSERSEMDVPSALDKVILACLAKHPEDRPQTAGELSRLLGASVESESWSEERAHRWWDRHHPQPNWAQPSDGGQRMLTKTMEEMWEPGETPSPELDHARL